MEKNQFVLKKCILLVDDDPFSDLVFFLSFFIYVVIVFSWIMENKSNLTPSQKTQTETLLKLKAFSYAKIAQKVGISKAFVSKIAKHF